MGQVRSGSKFRPGCMMCLSAPRSAFPPRSQPALSVPVWGGQATTRNLSVQPHQQKMLPFIPYRGRPEPRS